MSPAENVPAAVTRIGLLATRNSALGLLRNSFKARNDVVAAMITELWMESLKTAAVANALAPHYALLDPQRALLGGLMYNVGAMLLLTKLDEKTRDY
ncbi:MAG: HD-like signal output (HDOD) protein [Granulosicoccus sp.]|jgi:HD-like signal output (HDOD) protein